MGVYMCLSTLVNICDILEKLFNFIKPVYGMCATLDLSLAAQTVLASFCRLVSMGVVLCVSCGF